MAEFELVVLTVWGGLILGLGGLLGWFYWWLKRGEG